MCGKTGTVENPHGKDHAVFFAFAPRHNPKIAIAVVVENVGFGSTWAAPIASLMVEKYLRDNISRPQSYIDRIYTANLLPALKVKPPTASVDSLKNSSQAKPTTTQKQKAQ